MYRGELPAESLLIREPSTGDSLQLEGHEIRFIDLFMVETVHATAFYLPAQKAFIAGDLVYAQAQHYMSDVNDPDTWIAALEDVRKVGSIENAYSPVTDQSEGPSFSTPAFSGYAITRKSPSRAFVSWTSPKP